MEALLLPALAVSAVALAVAGNWRRSRPEPLPPPTPNCLLTKAPIEFWTGQRSLFYFASYWNGLPEWLAGHGYDVRTVRFPWRDPIARRRLAEQRLKAGTTHLVLDPGTALEFADLLAERPPTSVLIPRLDSPVRGLDGGLFLLHRWMIRGNTRDLLPPSAAGLGLGASKAILRQQVLREITRRAESEWSDGDSA